MLVIQGVVATPGRSAFFIHIHILGLSYYYEEEEDGW